MTGTVLLERRGRVAIATINRPRSPSMRSISK